MNNDTNNSNEPDKPLGQSIPITDAAEAESVPVTNQNQPPTAPAETPVEVAETEPEVVEEVAAPEEPEPTPETTAAEPEAPVESAPSILAIEEPATKAEEHQDDTPEPGPTAATVLPPVQHKSKTLKIVASIVVVAIALLAAAWLVFGMGDSKESTNKQTTVVANIPLLRVADTNGPIGLDTIFPNAPAAQVSQQIDFQVFEGLVGYSNERIVPLLATSWTNPDNNTWVFKLKDGVTFHDGTAVTAKDVKTSLDSLAKDKYWGQFMQTVASVTTNTENEVTIKTTSPDSLLLNRLVYGFVYKTNADKTVSGTGAYTVDAANSKTEDKTRIVAYEKYHQGVPKTKVVEYSIYPDHASVVKAIDEGKIDYTTTEKDDAKTQTLSQKGYGNTTYSATGAYGITMNMVKTGSPLQKIEVRQALAYALDRATYVTESKSTRFATFYSLPKAVVGYDETAKFPDFNSAKAKELTTKAGYAAGVPLTFNYIGGLQSDVPPLVAILNKSGFNITAKAYPSPKEFVQATGAGNYDLFIGSFSSDLGDGLDIYSGLLGSNSQFPSYNNPQFDAMLTAASQAFKAEEHVAKVKEITRYVEDNSLWLPVSNSESTIFYPKDYTFKLDSVQGVNGMYFWKLGTTQTTSASK